ncbi:sugar ABC transporter permease [Mesorhizobium sp. VK23B]|uniref:Sugar ABC transporter permease n=1 Tax=Mesorhizobium dulcispinae TaxID=3072316 RepID=A0ABU4XBV1_9HYPH|nr:MULTISPECIES: sugar ABC transporter permease [unclassified Mesorhizobium]MDX8465695.1 sugar ABC transporter permease [Mesorhizobium sp. VK23B]MDX8471503.1 sugar ABC transporter permease [Mesorhizobium sp. VK23A]
MYREKHFHWLILPTFVLLAAGTLYPIAYTGYLSLLEWNWGSTSKFVGLRNFYRIFAGVGFPKALFNTFYFAISAVVIETLLGLGLALAINRIRFGAGLIRTLMIMPLMVSGIAVALVWKVMLDPTLGIVNYLLSLVGIAGPAWLGTVPTAMPSIIMIDTWWQTAFTFIILSSALKSLPSEPFEAAKLEGATPFQTFRFVTLPMLKPVLITIVIFRTIDTMKVFDIIFGTTGGGPLRATESVQTLAYQTAFKSYKFGESATIAVVFSLIILLLCVVYLIIDSANGERT